MAKAPEKLVCNIAENKRTIWIASYQIQQLQDLIYRVEALYNAPKISSLYNTILKTVREVFLCDDIFAASISHLKLRKDTLKTSPDKSREKHAMVLGELLPDLAILQGSVRAFIEVHLSEQEKYRMGFYKPGTEMESID